MKRSSSYGERDAAFGQMMLMLRTRIGLTQTELAERLGVSRRAVAEWEAGSSYPKAERLKQLIALALRASAFPVGREAEEIHALWKAAHQKVLLDEPWLEGLLGKQHPALTLVASRSVKEIHPDEQALSKSASGPRVDWGEAIDVSSFYNRQGEATTLAEWMVQERCQVVSVLGMGGIGKSALATKVMHQVSPHFKVVLWRSLRDAPTCEALLEDCLQVLAPQPLANVPDGLEERLKLLLEYMRDERALLVFDNLEALLEEGEHTGRVRIGYEGYTRLLRRVAQTEHQSCLLLTSREKAGELIPLEGIRMLVRSLRLSGLEARGWRTVDSGRGITGQCTGASATDRALWGQPTGHQDRGADHRRPLWRGDRAFPGPEHGCLWQHRRAAR